MGLTEQQIAFFRTFGFLKFPGLDAPVLSVDFGVLPPPRDDIPRYAAKPRPPQSAP